MNKIISVNRGFRSAVAERFCERKVEWKKVFIRATFHQQLVCLLLEFHIGLHQIIKEVVKIFGKNGSGIFYRLCPRIQVCKERGKWIGALTGQDRLESSIEITICIGNVLQGCGICDRVKRI